MCVATATTGMFSSMSAIGPCFISYYHFTIGQRRGLDIGGSAERTYVVDVNPFTKRVTVGPASMLEKDELTAQRVHWIAGSPPTGPIEVQARVRSRMPDVAATVTPLDGTRARVTFAPCPSSTLINPSTSVASLRQSSIVCRTSG